MRDFYAVVCYHPRGFVMSTILQEFYKGAGARMRMHGENPAVALVRLVARNRRRYGGYVVHFGMGDPCSRPSPGRPSGRSST
jgi:cytochrome c-type biogenesis protein CcmF